MTDRTLPRRMAGRETMPNQVSNWFIRWDDVGVKWKLTRAPRNIHPASSAG